MELAKKFILQKDNGTTQLGTTLSLSYNNGVYKISSFETTRELHKDWNDFEYWSEMVEIFDCNYQTIFTMQKRKSEKQTKIAMDYLENFYKKLVEQLENASK